jgi:hypothetical protein
MFAPRPSPLAPRPSVTRSAWGRRSGSVESFSPSTFALHRRLASLGGYVRSSPPRPWPLGDSVGLGPTVGLGRVLFALDLRPSSSPRFARRLCSLLAPRSSPLAPRPSFVKHYGEVKALDGLDLAVPEGTVLGLLGPNGAGKTTAVRILTTLLAARRRAPAEVAGVDVLADPPGARDDRAVRAVRRRRRAPHRLREPRHDRPALPAGPSASRVRARELLERFDLDRRRRPAGQDLLGRDAPPARPRRRARRRARRCCSSTSRPPASTRAAAPTCGT